MSFGPIDSLPPVPVPQTTNDTIWRGPHEKPGEHHGHPHGRGAPPAETPGEDAEHAPGSDFVGSIIDVRV
jgi:hypothetical protein